jgi:hypothetical protein
LRSVTGVTKLDPSIFSKVYLNFFSLLVGILESFLGSCQSSSCQHALSRFSHTGSDASHTASPTQSSTSLTFPWHTMFQLTRLWRLSHSITVTSVQEEMPAHTQSVQRLLT